MKYATINEATEAWVNGFNAIPRSMIAKLMLTEMDDWHEVTVPTVGDRAYVYDVPEEIDTLEHVGEIQSYDDKSTLYCIELDDGKRVYAAEGDFEIIRDDYLPMWRNMWSFGDSTDDYWLEEMKGIELMSECGFRIYESDEFGYFFGIDGAGYDFYEAHWIPLYKVRGLQWHDPVAEREAQMLNKGYHKGKLGGKLVWLDKDDNMVAEV